MGRPRGSRNKTHVAKVPLTCEFCGALYAVYPSQVFRNGKPSRFCSLPCQRKGTAEERAAAIRDDKNPNWNGGRSSYRTRAIRARGARCESCGYKKYEQLLWVHHKDLRPRAQQVDHSLENLEVLCIRCHLELHLEAEDAVQEPLADETDVRCGRPRRSAGKHAARMGASHKE